MKILPIRFIAPMIEVIKAERKTQTRRIIKPQPTKQWAVDTFCKEGPGSVSASDLTAADIEMDEIMENCPRPVDSLLRVEGTDIFLKVTNVKIERLQDISEEDAVAEGAVFWMYPDGKNAIGGDDLYNAITCFYGLWNSIYGPQSWDQNPWVWVYTVEATTKSENV